jgi:hypothetical protein
VDAAGNVSPPSGTLTATTASGPAVVTFAPTADATIDGSNPTANLGTTNRITVDTSPANDFLLRFDITGTGAGTACPTITGAKLRLTVGTNTSDNSDRGGELRGAANTPWSESTVTWNTAPAANTGPPVATITTPVALGATYLVDVSPLVTGNGTVTIRATGISTDGARYYSKDGNPPSVAPQLQLSCG